MHVRARLFSLGCLGSFGAEATSCMHALMRSQPGLLPGSMVSQKGGWAPRVGLAGGVGIYRRVGYLQWSRCLFSDVSLEGTPFTTSCLFLNPSGELGGLAGEARRSPRVGKVQGMVKRCCTAYKLHAFLGSLRRVDL